jgi:hypothetical protein
MRHNFFIAAAAFIFCSGSSLAQDAFPALRANDAAGLHIMSEKLYDGNSLWGYIDGGADVYLEYGFSKLLARKAEAHGIRFQIDLYRMNDAESAFGIFSISAAATSRDDSLPAVHCISRYQIQAARGAYYLSIINDKGSAEAGHVGIAIARRLLNQIDAPARELPPLFHIDAFSTQAASVKFIKGLLGLQNGYPGWEGLFGDSGHYSFYVATVRSDTSDLSLAQIAFGSTDDLNAFAARVGFHSSALERFQQREAGGTTRCLWNLGGDHVVYVEMKADSLSAALLINTIRNVLSP